MSTLNFQSTKIAVIGMGYVGLPLAVEFGKKWNTIGFDINEERIHELLHGIDRTGEINTEEFGSKSLLYSCNSLDIAEANIYILTVPTPIDAANLPDLSAIKNASKLIASFLQEGDLVIYESTVYPGLTEEICVPILERSDFKLN